LDQISTQRQNKIENDEENQEIDQLVNFLDCGTAGGHDGDISWYEVECIKFKQKRKNGGDDASSN